ncbi:MAG: hypothetical protein IKZ97_05010 [Butyrivibrio sp.]|nr:hypothetical protein [Butyrivibrio sp.]
MSIEIMRDLFSYELYERSFSPMAKYTRSEEEKSKEKSEEESLAKLEYEMRKAEREKSVADQSMCYAEKLRAARNKSKATSLQKKKLQYNFKKISSMIMRSKNSVSARKAVQSARREVMRLNRLKGSDEYDEEELQLAIDHAKAMVKVAKKKVHHLEQEEMIERGSGAINGEPDEKEGKSAEEKDAEEEPADSNGEDAREELIDESWEEEALPEDWYDEELTEEFFLERPQIQDIQMDVVKSSNDAMAELMNELSEEMESMMEELDLTDLAETMYAPDPNMSEDDLKMLKIKHRTKEMKEIAEADKEYLKKLFAYEESKKNSSSSAVSAAISGNSASIIKVGTSSVTPVISMPGSAAGGMSAAPMSPGGIDVSV